MSDIKKPSRNYLRDGSGHLYCDKCDFKPKATDKHPNGNPSTMHYHLKKHDGDFTYICNTCKKGFLHKQPYENHIVSKHSNEATTTRNNVTMFECPESTCVFKSLTKANCRIHFIRKHCPEIISKYCKTEKNIDTDLVFECLQCNNNFKSHTAMLYHVGQCLSDNNVKINQLLTDML